MKQIIDFTVETNRKLNEEMFLLTLHSPVELPEVKPGQFVSVKVENSPTTFLRRPISVHDTDRHKGLLYLLIKIAGDGTKQLSEMEQGEKLNVILPLGNGFSMPEKGNYLLVGGGVGIAPMLYLAKMMKSRGMTPTVLIGCRSRRDIVLKETFEQYGPLFYTTEDGSYGEKGYPTEHYLFNRKFDGLFCCGPEPMMKAVARYAYDNHIDCQVSLENSMACGIGVCLCCVTDTKKGHQCVCTEGPVFNIKELKWQI